MAFRGPRYLAWMSSLPEPTGSDPDPRDASRRTWLAAERTWLAWWRTGLGATAVAVGVGRILPGLAGGERWPLKALGLGYGVLAVAVLVIGGLRQASVATALRRGSYDQLSGPLVLWLTAAGVILALGTIAVVAVAS
jgi:putative membrane protein